MIPKFRAWDKVNKKLKQVYSIDFDENGEIQSIKDEYTKPNEMYAMFEIEYFELMQSTGLKDMKDTEIYEGDIVKNEYDEIYVVKWFDAGFHLEEKYNGGFDYFELHFGDNKEVIGNIYENPELLEDN